MSVTTLNRRNFLKTSSAAGAGLVIGFYLPSSLNAAAADDGSAAINAFLRIAPDDSITVIVNKSEMGQGVQTSLPMILAEELDADWSKVHTEFAPVAPEYNHTQFGVQLTGGSTSVSSSYDQLRKAGATARAMLLAAAASAWQVDAAGLRTENGFVVHDASKRRSSYGKLAAAAAKIEPPKEVKLKDAKDFKLIGKPAHRLDSREKSTGKAIFGLDVTVPGMAIALVARPPVFGGKAKSVDATKAKAVPGVRNVVEVDTGIAVIADRFWAAKRGRDALVVQWDDGSLAGHNTERQRKQYAELAETPGLVARKDGDVAAAMTGAKKKLEAVYEVPYIAHAPMEPLNCVVDLKADRCEIWTGTQSQTLDRAVAAQVLGFKPEQVSLHTTYLGGGFGRRAVTDSHFVKEAVQIAKAINGPVKVIWTREDDIRGGYYRPMWLSKLSAGLGEDGKPVAWTHRIVGQSIIRGTLFERSMMQNGLDPSSVEGASDMPYSVPNVLVDLHSPVNSVPVLWWRSVGNSHTGFVVESFIDEVAHAAGKDPLEYRRMLITSQPRRIGVLNLAAEKAGWGKKLPAGHFHGLAAHFSFGSYVAHVVELSVGGDGTPRVHKVVSAVDCGQVVNPEQVRAQIEGAVVFAMTATLKSEITFENGRVAQSNFHNYPLVRMAESPEVEVHIVPSSETHGGIGEPGIPPLAAAVANAIFAATGKRVRKLPIRPQDVKA